MHGRDAVKGLRPNCIQCEGRHNPDNIGKFVSDPPGAHCSYTCYTRFCTQVYMHVHTCVYMHVYAHVYVQVYKLVYTCVCVSMHMTICVSIHMSIHMSIRLSRSIPIRHVLLHMHA